MTKKIFTLLTALVLSIGIGWAQELTLIPVDRPLTIAERMQYEKMGVQLPTEAERKAAIESAEESVKRVSKKSRKAPQYNATSHTYAFSWSDFASNSQVTSGTSTIIRDFRWYAGGSGNPKLRLITCYLKSDAMTYNGDQVIPYGTYTFSTASNAGNCAAYRWVFNNAGYPSQYYDSDGTYNWLNSGTVTVTEGADGPYIVVSAKGANNNNSSAYTSTNNTYEITVGSPKAKTAGTISVDVASGQSAMGTVSGGGYGAGGAEIQISAEGKGDYIFDHWNDNVKDNPRTVVVNGDQTYTAYFVDKNAAAWRAFETAHIQSSNIISVNAGVGYYDAKFNFEDNILQMIVHDTQGPQQNNYLVFSIKCTTQSYNGILGPTPGDYYAVVPKLYYSGYEAPPYDYWYINNKPAEYVLGRGYDSYYYSSPNYTHFSDHLSLSETNERYLNSSTFHVEEGENGNMFLKIIKPDEGVIITVGHPAPQVTTHTVTFKNYDGTVLQESQVAENTTPVYSGTAPTKGATEQFEYTFTGWNDGTTSYAKDATLPAVGSNDVIYTATFSETTRQYTVTIAPATGGTIEVKNDATPISSGTKVDYGTTLTIKATPDTGYSFDAWIGGVTSSPSMTWDSEIGTITVDGDKTIGATFAINTYTLTMDVCENGTYSVTFGESELDYIGSDQTFYNIPYGTKVTLEAYPTENFKFKGWQRVEEIEEWGAPRRAVTFEMDDEPGSIVEGGSVEELEKANPFVFQMTKNVEYQAIFESSLVSHTLTLHPTMSAGSTGIIQVTGNNDTITSSEGSVKCTIYEGVEYTCQLISNDNNGWGWWLEGDFPISSEQEIKITPTADVDLYAGFGLERVELDGKKDADFYSTYENNMIHELVYLRTFSAKTWSTMWMPFSFDVTQQGLSGKVYTLSKTAIEKQTEGIVDVALTFHKYASGVIGGGELFIFYTPTEIKDFVFSDVLMDTFKPTDKLYGDDATTHSGVYFLGTKIRRKVGGEGPEALQKSYRYIKGNVLYYPALNKGIMANTFLGYFQMKDYEYWYGGGSSAAPRMRIIVDDETVITEAETDNEVETRKYINDEGYLIIERNGTKYTANGAVLE